MNLENSLYRVTPGPFHAEIEIPTSKSYANRALIIGALRGNGFTIHQLSDSTDVTTLLSCLQQVGLKISRAKSSVTFQNSFPQCEEEIKDEIIELRTGDGGTTNRFLLALLSRGKKTYRLIPSEKMNERPMEDLLTPLRELNVQIDTNKNGAWIEIKGPALLKSSSMEVDCAKSTQFASAMMLAFAYGPLSIVPVNVSASETYLAMTRHILQESFSKNTLDVPVDFSSLSYPFVLAITKGEVLVTNCKKLDPNQADSGLIDLGIKINADVEWTERGLRVSCKKRLKPFVADGSRFPDLVPALVYLASQIQGVSVLTNLSVLRHKESDRLEELSKILTAFAIAFQYDESRSEIKIQGIAPAQSPVTLTPARDHRMVMTAFLFMKAGAGGMLGHIDCVEKSFPKFFQIMNGVTQ